MPYNTDVHSTRHIASSTLWQVGSQLAMAALSIATVKCVAVALSTEMAGYYNSSYGFLQLFGILADFGLYAVAVREVSKSKDQARTLGDLITLRSLILFLSLGVAILLAWTNPAWRGTPFPLAVTLAAAVPLCTLLSGILRTVFQVRYRMRPVFVAEVSQRVLALTIIAALAFGGLHSGDDTFLLYAFIVAGGIGALLLLCVSLVAARRLMPIRPRWEKEALKKLLAQAAPYGLAFLCTALYRQMDITLIASLRDDFELQNASYGFAQRAAEMAFLFPTLLLNSTLPILSRRHEEGEDTRGLLGKTLLSALLLSLTAALFAFFWARPLMQLLTRDAYLSTPLHPGSDTALALLALPMLLNGVVLFSFYTLLTRHAWKPLVATLAVGALLSLGLNFWLIPTHGFVGACWTSIAVHVLLAVLLLPQALRALPAAFPWRYALQLGGYALPLLIFLKTSAPYLTSIPITLSAGFGSIGVMAGGFMATRLHKSLRGA
jgi:O-antigen/teichoic acid export membrane protein